MIYSIFFFQAEDGIRDGHVTGVQTCALPISMDGILPDMISKRRNKIGFTTPESEWFRRIAPTLREIFSSDSFASRPYFDAPSVNALFDDYIANPGNHGTMMFWRLLNVELWMREFKIGRAHV